MSIHSKIDTCWEDIYFQRILVHCYMISRLQHSPDDIFNRVAIPGDDVQKNRLKGYLFFLKTSPSIIKSDNFLIDDANLGNENPIAIVEEYIVKEVGDLDKLRVHLNGERDGVTFTQFYQLAFDVNNAERFRKGIVSNLVYLLDSNHISVMHLTSEEYHELQDYSDVDAYFISHNSWKLVIVVSSSFESKTQLILLTHRLARRKDAIGVMVGLAFSEAAQLDSLEDPISKTKPIHLLNLLGFLKLSSELEQIKAKKRIAIARENFSKLFSGNGGLVVISDWSKQIKDGV